MKSNKKIDDLVDVLWLRLAQSHTAFVAISLPLIALDAAGIFPAPALAILAVSLPALLPWAIQAMRVHRAIKGAKS